MSLLRSLTRPLFPGKNFCEKCRRGFAVSASRSEEARKTQFTDLLEMHRDNLSSPRSSPKHEIRQAGLVRREDRASPPRYASARQAILDIGRDTDSRRQADAASMQATMDRQDLERQMYRRWKTGDVYSPHDLSGVEMSKWKQVQPRGRPKKDVLDELRINPLEQYKNFAMMSEYITDMGRIKGITETGLRPVNQRKMAKAIRRAVGLGLLPSVHKHPEIIRKQLEQQNRRRK